MVYGFRKPNCHTEISSPASNLQFSMTGYSRFDEAKRMELKNNVSSCIAKLKMKVTVLLY